MIEIEIACNSLTSCINAFEAGATRVELFENLADGGCTPSAGLIMASQKLNIPKYVMIRPRAGHFCYSKVEIDMMLHDIEICKQANIQGIVFGCLTQSGSIDLSTNKLLLEAWGGAATFHRAIDRTQDLFESAKAITDLGFKRILSSGGQITAEEGIEILRKMQKEFGKYIHIMPGSGITSKNAVSILRDTGCTNIHATCKVTVPSKKGTINPIFAENDTETFSELTEIRNLIEAIEKWHSTNS
jgi:copper homeostasis protein